LRQLGEATVEDLRQALMPERPLANASVSTLLERLEAKGLVTRRKAERGMAFLFTVTARAEGALQGQVRRLVERVFGGDPLSLVAALYGGRAPRSAELSRLEELVAELRAREEKAP
jgi:BlaI family penicillinase repressor